MHGRHSILLVEDNVDAANSLADLLGLTGCQVTVAHDGAEAVRTALQIAPDLILSDLVRSLQLAGSAGQRAMKPRELAGKGFFE